MPIQKSLETYWMHYIYIYICIHTHTHIYIYIYIYVHFSPLISIYLSIYFPVLIYLFICLLVYLSIYLSIYLTLTFYPSSWLWWSNKPTAPPVKLNLPNQCSIDDNKPSDGDSRDPEYTFIVLTGRSTLTRSGSTV